MGKNVVSDEEGKPSIFILILDQNYAQETFWVSHICRCWIWKTDEFEVEDEYEREHVDGHRGGRDIDDDEEDEEDGTVFRVFPFFRKRVSKS